MEKFGTYKILHDKQLIVEYYTGLISAEDIIHFKNIIKKEPNYNFSSDTIIDFRDCILKIDVEDLQMVIDFFKATFGKEEKRTNCYLTSKPNELVLATLYTILAENSEMNFSSNVFSTIKPIVGLFGEEVITEKEYIEIIEELKISPNNVFTKQE